MSDNTKSAPKRQPLRPGIVFSVPSGDTVVIIDPDVNVSTKPPKEVQLTLSGLKAPLLGKKYVKDGKSVVEKDEPWAWASREYLRNLLIGKSVVFRVDYEAGNRSYGEVWIGEMNVRIELVRLGWSDIIEKAPKDGREPREEDVYLKELRDSARSRKIGVFRDSGKGAVRAVKYHESVRGRSDAPLFEFFEKNKNKPLRGVVEQVRSGSTLRVLLTNQFDNILLLLSGIRSPTFSFANDALSEPYSRQAKFITEFMLLHRDVTVVIEGIDKFSNFFGTVVDDKKRNIAINLLELGLAQFIDWSASSAADVKAFKDAEAKAQKAKAGIWKLQAVPKPSKPSNAPGDNEGFQGKVIEVVNAGTIVVRRELKGHGPEDVRISFSSIVVPRLLPRTVDEKEIEKEAKMNESQREKREEERRASFYAWQGKEQLRSRLVGKVVRCVLDYVRPSFTPKGSDKVVPAKEFYGVYVKDKNVVLDLVSNGLANVVNHGTDEPRSPDFQKLIIAEKQAEKAGVGLHSKARVPVVHVNDLTQQDRAKSQSYVPALKRAGRVAASVDYVFTGSRFKLYVPSEELMICFALQGIMSEKVQKAPGKKGEAQDVTEMYPASISIGNQALHVSRENLLQHDVEIEVDGCDKGGNFIGSLYLKKQFYGTDLVRQGLAKVHHRSAESLKSYNDLKDAENEAKDRRRAVWADYDPEEEKRKEAEAIAAREAAFAAKTEAAKISIIVTDIEDGGNFWYQQVGDSTAALESLMTTFQAQDFASLPAITPKKGDIVAAQFGIDNNWYRAEVTRVNPGKKEGEETTYQLLYVDYGNVEIVNGSRIRQLGKDFSLTVLPKQAVRARLAFVRAPKLDQDFGVDAAATLKEFVWDKKLTATVYYKDADSTYVTIGADTKSSINSLLVAQGLARVQKSRTKSSFYEGLLEEQQKAKDRRLNIWQYGDADSDEE